MRKMLVRTAAVLVCCGAIGACVSQDPGSGADEEQVGEAEEAVITNCLWTGPNIDFSKELVITDIGTVEDACRTNWTGGGGCPAGSVGAWTFGKLMTDMAGSRAPSDFVAQWLETFQMNYNINGFVTPTALPNIRSMLIDKWLVASGCAAGDKLIAGGNGTGPVCTLNLTVAPFRLLAIVNRVDVGGTAVIGGTPGEGRFVFGFVDPATGNPLHATVILEYKLPTSTKTTADWAALFHGLGALTPGTAVYNQALQNITDQFTKPYVNAAGTPNYQSAIGQVRTNDGEFAQSKAWQLREYHLTPDPSGLIDKYILFPAPLAQTPDISLDGGVSLSAWLTGHTADIDSESPFLRSSDLAGSILQPMNFYWHNPGGLTWQERHLFGFGTCNGCHTAETANSFNTHIEVRAAGSASVLHNFLGVSAAPAAGGHYPAATYSFADPATGNTLSYNEPWRRVCEMRRLLNGVLDPYTKPSGAH